MIPHLKVAVLSLILKAIFYAQVDVCFEKHGYFSITCFITIKLGLSSKIYPLREGAIHLVARL